MKKNKLLVLATSIILSAGLLFPKASGAQSASTDVLPVVAETADVQSDSWRDKIAPDLLETLDRASADANQPLVQRPADEPSGPIVDQDGYVNVIVKLHPRNKITRRSTSDAASTVNSVGGIFGKALPLINAIVARVPLAAVEQLSRRDGIDYVCPDRPVSVMGHLDVTTGAAQARSLVSGLLSVDGTGVGIAVLDSGIDTTHHELTYNGVSRVSVNVRCARFYDASDYNGHGTHIAAVAAGTNHVGPSLYTGVAPGASIINVKVLDRSGKGYASDIIDGVNWCVNNRAYYNIKVMNLSLGTPAIDSYRNDPLCQAVRAAHDAGIVVVVAAGNDGKDKNGNKIYGTIHSPGIEPSAITVGAANTKGTDARSDDVVCTYSSHGPTRGYTSSGGVRVYDNYIKPDLVAPGNKIISAEAYNCDTIRDHPELDANQYESNSYHYVMYMSGTSVAAPVVSGAAALLLQVNPTLTPNLIKAILMYSAQPLPGFNVLEQGTGLLNIDGAIRLAKCIRNPLPVLGNGQSMVLWSLPAAQTTIAGHTFGWAQGIITDWTFVYGSPLMSCWQGMYAKSALLADGTYLSGGAILKNSSYLSSSIQIGPGVVLSDGTLLSEGTLVTNGEGWRLADGTLLSEGTLMADAIVTCDGTLLSEGTLMSDAYGLFIAGEGSLYMLPGHDTTSQ